MRRTLVQNKFNYNQNFFLEISLEEHHFKFYNMYTGVCISLGRTRTEVASTNVKYNFYFVDSKLFFLHLAKRFQSRSCR